MGASQYLRFSVAIGLLFLSMAPTLAAESQPYMSTKGCTRLAVRRVEERGRIVYLAAANTSWIFSARPLHLQLDPDPVGLTSPEPVLTEDGQFRVVAQPDGTVRWFAHKSGAERLALCLNEATQQWVAFTKRGYYEGSDHGDRLVGWEVPGSLQKSDFFPLELLKQTFHHASVVSRMLSSDEEDIKIAATLLGGDRLPPSDIRMVLPPIIKVVWPPMEYSTHEPSLTVQMRVRSPGGQPIEVLASSASGAPQKIRIPGRADATDTKSLPVSSSPGRTLYATIPAGTSPVARKYGQAQEEDPGQLVSVTVGIPQADSVVEVHAQSLGSNDQPLATTAPLSLKITWTGEKKSQEKPDVYLLAIGVGTYRDKKLTQLEYPSKDARDFEATFLAQRGRSYRNVKSLVLTDQDATRERVLAELDNLQRQELRENDLAVVFLAGHGDGDDEAGVYHFLPYDAVLAAPEKTMIEASMLQKLLRSRKGGRMLFFIDTCHSGSVLAGGSFLQDLTAQLARDGNLVVFTSSTGGQVSQEWKKWRNGAFTKAAVEGLKGEADQDGKGQVTVTLLEHYISQRVKELTSEQQTPTFIKPGSIPDFNIAKVYVPIWRRRWARWTAGGVLLGTLIASGIVLGTQYHPEYQRGNTGWLVQF